MIIKEEKLNNYRLTFNSIHLSNCNDNFIILDDKSYIINKEFENITNAIKKYNYNVKIIDINYASSILLQYLKKKNIIFDTVVLVGTGGKNTFSPIKNDTFFDRKEIIELQWHRKWNNSKSLGFETNINNFDFKDKKIMLFEDVIASGSTIFTLKNLIEKNGGKVIGISSILIQETSPLINKSFCNTYSSIMINKPEDINLDPFWYPPIYSLRHLLHGDDEMPNIYDELNKHYFNNINNIELLVKEYREK